MAAGMLNRDYKDEEYREPSDGYTGELPTKGMYPARLVRAGEHTSKAGNDSVEWIFELLDGAENKNGDSVAGWPGYIYTNEDSAAWKEQQILVALGAIKPNGKIKMSFDMLMKRYGKKPVTVRIVLEEYLPEDGEREWRPKITTVMPAKTDKAAAATEDGPDDDEEPPAKTSRTRGKKAAEPEPEPEDEDDDEDEDEEDQEGEEDIDLDELADELAAMALPALKKVGRSEYGLTAGQMRGKTAEEIIDTILEGLEEAEDEDEDEEEEEPDPEPTPPARASRRGTKTTTATSTAKKRRTSQEPPF